MAYGNNIIKFNNAFYEAIKLGLKTCTVRKGFKPYDLGLGKAISTNISEDFVSIVIVSITYKLFMDLTTEDAIADGYVNVDSLRYNLLNIYPDLMDRSVITVIKFELLHD